jgi:hypothetical protein
VCYCYQKSNLREKMKSNSIKEINQIEINQVCGGLTYKKFNEYYNKLEEMCEEGGVSVGFFLGSIVGFIVIAIDSIVYPTNKLLVRPIIHPRRIRD